MLRGFDAVKTQSSQLQSDLRQLKRTVGFALGIRDVLREQVTVKQAEEEIKKRIGNRAERFLKLVRTRIYEQPASPYRRLLKFAGCEYADLCNSVRRDGLEATLLRLALEGVYLTVGEYKGKQEVVRGSESFRVVPADLIQVEGAGYAKQTSGTRNAPVRNIMTADRLTERAFEENIFFAAHDLFSYAHAVYDGILPAGGGLNYLLGYAKVGVPVDRWFARKVPVNSRLEGCYHYLMTYLIVLMAKRYARAFPSPEFTDVADIG